MGDGEEGKFETGGDAGLVKDVGQVALHGLFTERELPGDVAVAAAFDDCSDDFEFARGEAVGFVLGRGGLLHQVVERGNQVDDALAADPVIAADDGADGGLQMAGEGVFKHDAAGTDVEGFNNLLRGDGGGEKENLDGRRAGHDGAHGLKAGHTRHLDIEEKNVRLEIEGLSDGLVAIGGIADYFKAVSEREHVAHANTNNGMVVCEYDANWPVHLSGYPPTDGSYLL